MALLAGCGPDDSAAPVSTTTEPVPTTTTTTVETVEQQAFREAEAAYRRHIALTNKLARHPGDKSLLKRLDDTSTGVEHDVEWVEYGTKWVDDGIRLIQGEIIVRRVAPQKAFLAKNPPEVHLRSCLDSSSTVAVDEKGKKIGGGKGPFFYKEDVAVIQGADLVWRVSKVTNEDVPSC